MRSDKTSVRGEASWRTKGDKPMPRTVDCIALALAAACVAGSARAGTAQDSECRAAVSQAQPLANRNATIASLEQMPDSCLKSLLVECSENAGQRLLDLGSAAVCSMGYEALLHKGFGGSFGAMMVWWQRDRDARL